ncbi:MAG: gliding motility-associated C-terminal domain-containing protein [Bacteroidota bacterium]
MRSRLPYLLYYLSVLLFLVLYSQSAMATHNRAGEITYIQTGPLSIFATITTYTKASSGPADRDSLEICWGDGNCQWIARVNGPDNDNNGVPDGELLPNDTKVNYYTASYTYPGQTRYTISMTDPNRNGDILNVNPPNSDNVPFHLETTVTFFNLSTDGLNNSPVLLQPPIDIACTNKIFIHNPNAYDIDGDSLGYRLIVPLQDINTPVPNYSFPDMIVPGPANSISFNQSTGEFTWLTPQRAGEYNIAMYIIQYRNGNPVDTMIRDMQILVEECENDPPEIEVEERICVVAGELIDIDVVATAPLSESTQRVAMTANGGPLILTPSPAEFTVAPGYQSQPLTGRFRWQTTCEHISSQFYTVIFRAVDDFPIVDNNNDTLYLSTLKTLRIKVMGPPPEDVQAEATSQEVEVTWEQPYDCEAADNDYFRGFSVWRREGSNQFTPGECETGLAGRGYTRLNIILTRDIENGRYTYTDTDVERGRTYCYRILGEFARTTPGGNPFNFVESIPSEEICVQLSRDIPLITNVSVQQTDQNNGEIFVAWTKPDPEDLDTILNPGPYTYEVLRSTGITDMGFQAIPGAIFTSPTFAGANMTEYTDVGLNTADNPYSYQVAFYVNNETEPLGFANATSSVFLSIASTDETNNLSWEEMVSWNNFEYIIFRFNNNTSSWDSIGISNEPRFSDTGLVNGNEYCYYIESRGSYGIDDIPRPLINLSQEECGIPLDTIPPCPPELIVNNICNDPAFVNDCATGNSLQNELVWVNPNFLCEDTDDVVGYNVYYTALEGGEFQLIHSTLESFDTTHIHMPETGIAGCYAVTAIDTFNNESAFSNIICVDNCPIYELPNVFTPNNDGAHDLFEPFPYCFVESINLQVFNRWGQVVFETSDPDIRWDGTNLSGEQLAEGTYFYVCEVFEQRVSGVVPRPDLLDGYIQIIIGN